MTIDRTKKHFGKRNFVPLIKTSAIAIGVIAVACVAVAAAQHALSPRQTAIDVAATAGTTSARETASPGSNSATESAPRGDARGEDGRRIDSPRECQPKLGIVTECIY